MKTAIANVIVIAALSLNGAALAAEETGGTELKLQQQLPPTSPAETPQPAVKSPTPEKGMPRPKDLDLRHCLELKTDAEIAKCAGEL